MPGLKIERIDANRALCHGPMGAAIAHGAELVDTAYTLVREDPSGDASERAIEMCAIAGAWGEKTPGMQLSRAREWARLRIAPSNAAGALEAWKNAHVEFEHDVETASLITAQAAARRRMAELGFRLDQGQGRRWTIEVKERSGVQDGGGTSWIDERTVRTTIRIHRERRHAEIWAEARKAIDATAGEIIMKSDQSR